MLAYLADMTGSSRSMVHQHQLDVAQDAFLSAASVEAAAKPDLAERNNVNRLTAPEIGAHSLFRRSKSAQSTRFLLPEPINPRSVTKMVAEGSWI